MRGSVFLMLFACALALSACNKSSPPPQEPVKPRGAVQIEMPLQPPAP
ncbi:MAG TPA: hypothetical protein VHU18_15110 [Rhizomicrobium sp.]|jgi:hypothetical protein|nr:hypothetical protein [Rhizomicrobium sp.]